MGKRKLHGWWAEVRWRLSCLSRYSNPRDRSTKLTAFFQATHYDIILISPPRSSNLRRKLLCPWKSSHTVGSGRPQRRHTCFARGMRLRIRWTMYLLSGQDLVRFSAHPVHGYTCTRLSARQSARCCDRQSTILGVMTDCQIDCGRHGELPHPRIINHESNKKFSYIL